MFVRANATLQWVRSTVSLSWFSWATMFKKIYPGLAAALRRLLF